MKKLLIILFIAVFLSACSGGGAAEDPTSAPQFDISDPAKNLEAAVGNEFKIVIDSNPTSGYHWEIVGEVDESIVESISKDYRADEPVSVGSGGVEIFTFKALKTGETLITLGYYPPSNDAVEPQQTVTFTVTVK